MDEESISPLEIPLQRMTSMTSGQNPGLASPSIIGRTPTMTSIHRGSQSTTSSRPSGRRSSRPSMSLAPSQVAALAKIKSSSTSSENSDKGSTSPVHSHEPGAVSTTKVLQLFRPKTTDPDLELALEKKRSASESHRIERQSYREILEEVKREMEKDTLPWKERLKYFFSRNHHNPAYKDQQKLLNMARHFYPPRGQLKVYVCDIGPKHAEHFETTVGEIEYCWKEKPDWATVRWIHAPVGKGLLHSSIEDLFLYDYKVRGRSFERAGTPDWPYLDIDCLNVRNQNHFQEMRDVHSLLSKRDDLKEALNNSILDGDINENLRSDMAWRSDHVGTPLEFWRVVQSDLPWQLSEGIALGQDGPIDGDDRKLGDAELQMLSTHPRYHNALLVRNPFRCFHRADGCLLTMSAAAGVDYLNRDLQTYLEESRDSLFQEEEATVVAHALSAFEKTGTKNWSKATVEWFLIYIVTELGATPHNIRQGHNAISIMNAFQYVVQGLKRRRFDKWQRKETVKLVREFLACSDELSNLRLIYARKRDFFQRLKEDCIRHNEEDEKAGVPLDNPTGETSLERAEWVLHRVSEEHDDCERLLADLLQSMNALFQLRSIEQNELAIVADSQNKAIVLFTGVTIVFLPLSFFTSYYGMNLNGIATTDKDESWFWEVCGTVALVIVCIVSLYAFRHSVLARLVNRRQVKAYR